MSLYKSKASQAFVFVSEIVSIERYALTTGVLTFS